MRTVTLSIDDARHQKLKETGQATGLAMSEIVRVALDRLWEDLGDLKKPNREILLEFYANKLSQSNE
ncbi:MAG TPA: hypothetical protein VF604_14725 [Pyrinomonadaceae bacterium]|jgi:hypothetical protein